MILKNLFASLAALAEMGHSMTASLSLSDSPRKFGDREASLFTKHCLFILKVSQERMKCASSSITWSEQYRQVLSFMGVGKGLL